MKDRIVNLWQRTLVPQSLLTRWCALNKHDQKKEIRGNFLCSDLHCYANQPRNFLKAEVAKHDHDCEVLCEIDCSSLKVVTRTRSCRTHRWEAFHTFKRKPAANRDAVVERVRLGSDSVPNRGVYYIILCLHTYHM